MRSDRRSVISVESVDSHVGASSWFVQVAMRVAQTQTYQEQDLGVLLPQPERGENVVEPVHEERRHRR